MINFLDDTLFGIDDTSCAGSTIFPVLQLTKFIIRIVQIAVPFGLVIWGSLDWFKALIAHDEKEMRMKRKPFIQRVIAAIIIIVLPILIELICSIITDQSTTTSIFTCYHEAKPIIDFSNWEEGDPDDDCYPFCGSGPAPKGNTPTTNEADDTSNQYDAPTGKVCEDYKGVSASTCRSHHCLAEMVSGQTGSYNCKTIENYGKDCQKYSNLDDNGETCEFYGCRWKEVNGGHYCVSKN